MKAATPAAVPVVEVQVAAVKGPASAAIASPDPPHPAEIADGHEAGERVLVELGGNWLQATLLERHGDRWLVHYDERGGAARDSLEELVENERIRVPVERIDDPMGPDDGDP